jgi:hypothetical protein
MVPNYFFYILYFYKFKSFTWKYNFHFQNIVKMILNFFGSNFFFFNKHAILVGK